MVVEVFQIPAEQRLAAGFRIACRLKRGNLFVQVVEVFEKVVQRAGGIPDGIGGISCGQRLDAVRLDDPSRRAGKAIQGV